MQYLDVLKRLKGETVVLNNSDERQLLEVEDDFIVLRGGNPQMLITEFVPVAHVVRVTRADYTGGSSSIAIDTSFSGGEHRRTVAD